MAIEGRVRELVEAKNFCHVGTIRKDGWPAVVPVWIDTDGEHLILNSAEGRGWVKNIERDSRLTCTVSNSENPYEFVQFRGRVVEQSNDGADEHINAMAKKYLDQDSYPFRQPSEVRIKFKVLPEQIYHRGG